MDTGKRSENRHTFELPISFLRICDDASFGTQVHQSVSLYIAHHHFTYISAQIQQQLLVLKVLRLIDGSLWKHDDHDQYMLSLFNRVRKNSVMCSFPSCDFNAAFHYKLYS